MCQPLAGQTVEETLPCGRCVSMFPVECASKVGMHSSLVYCSPEWIALQSPMELVAPDLKGKAVIGDDKDHSKIWVADQVDLCRYVEMDQTWARRDDLRPRDVSVWLWARAFWGPPCVA